MADLSVMSFLNEETQRESEYNLKDAQARQDIAAINSKIPSAASSNNKLVDTTAMNEAIGSAVGSAYKAAGSKTVAELTSSLLVEANNGNVYNMTDAGTTTADFIEGVGKPIRIGDNVGVCEPTSGTFKFDLLSGFIAVDTNPTQDSANPVSSGGVYSEFAGIKDGQSIDSFADVETALAGKVDKVTGKGLSTNDYTNEDKAVVTTAQDNIKANTKLIKDTVGWSGKQLIPFPYYDSSKTQNGITFTVNSDGTITVSGTATANSYFQLTNKMSYDADTDYTLNGCPSGGSLSSYLLYTGSASTGFNDIGNGVTKKGSEITDNTIYIAVYKNTVISSPITFKPMVRKADILDSTYEPYFGSTAFPRSEQAVTGAVNRLHIDLNSKTTQNVVITVDKKAGTVNLNGTNNGAQFSESFRDLTADDLEAGTYEINTFATPDSSKYYVGIDARLNGSWVKSLATLDTVSKKSFTLDWNGYDVVRVFIVVKASQQVSNLLIKPMIAFDTSVFAPYAMTNKELTEAVAFNNVEITNVNAGITLDTAWSYAYQVGNLVIYALRFTVGASAINENTILCSFGAECSKSMNADILPRQTGNHFLAALVADTTNHRTDFKTFGGATLTASNEYLVSGVYIAK